jgi:hypothetical protein
MVALEPNFIKIGKAAIFGDVFGEKVAMIVENGLWRRVLMIKSLRDLIR